MYFLFRILPVVAGIKCSNYPGDCSTMCFIEYDKSFMFSVHRGCWPDKVNYNDEYRIFCNYPECNNNDGTIRKPIECHGDHYGICYSCYIKDRPSVERGCYDKPGDSVISQSHDFSMEVCNTPKCNVWPYEHRCYSGYFGDCTWYIDSAKIHSPQEEKCDRIHLVNLCVDQKLINEPNNSRICYMYGCHHKNAQISVQMLVKGGRGFIVKNYLKIDFGYADAAQCYGPLCNIPRPRSNLHCFNNEGKLTLCPDYTTSCRRNENSNEKKCTPIGQTYLGCHDGNCDCSGDGCNTLKCVIMNQSESQSCPVSVNQCQIVWDSSTQEVKEQGCAPSETNVSQCFFDENWTRHICHCRPNNCNIPGDFKCYQSFNHELGKLGLCPINMKSCQTVRDSTTKLVIARSCSLAVSEYSDGKNEETPVREICHENGCNIWGSNGTVCYDSNLTEAISCPGEVFYCQTIWNLWTPENITQGCPSSNPSFVGCHFDEDRTIYICNCVGEECNKLGDFQCYQSFNHELGRLGPCPINTTGCRTLRDTATNEIFARSCLPIGLDSPVEEKKGQIYDTCHEPRCNNETVHGRWCPVGVKGRCFETWKNYLVPFHDLLPKTCYGFHDQCHTAKIKTSSGECTIHTCEFFDYTGNIDSTPAIEDKTCYKGPNSSHCVCEGDKCLDDVRTLLDMFMNQANGLHFGISVVGLIFIL